MDEKGLMQQDVTEHLWVTRQSIGHYLTGDRKISWPVAFALAYTLKINPECSWKGTGKKWL